MTFRGHMDGDSCHPNDTHIRVPALLAHPRSMSLLGWGGRVLSHVSCVIAAVSLRLSKLSQLKPVS